MTNRDFAFSVEWLSTHACAFKFTRTRNNWPLILHYAANLAIAAWLVSAISYFTHSEGQLSHHWTGCFQAWAERCTLASLAVGLFAFNVVKSTVIREELIVSRGIGLEWRRVKTLDGEEGVAETVSQVDVLDILINEGYQNFSTLSYLLILARGPHGNDKETVIVPFKYSTPPLEILMAIRQCAKELMMLDDKKDTARLF